MRALRQPAVRVLLNERLTSRQKCLCTQSALQQHRRLKLLRSCSFAVHPSSRDVCKSGAVSDSELLANAGKHRSPLVGHRTCTSGNLLCDLNVLEQMHVVSLAQQCISVSHTKTLCWTVAQIKKNSLVDLAPHARL